jgi:hypothetical protein
MYGELKGIGDNDSLSFDMFENPIFNSRHLCGKEIDIDIIISVNISQKEILF